MRRRAALPSTSRPNRPQPDMSPLLLRPRRSLSAARTDNVHARLAKLLRSRRAQQSSSHSNGQPNRTSGTVGDARDIGRRAGLRRRLPEAPHLQCSASARSTQPDRLGGSDTASSGARRMALRVHAALVGRRSPHRERSQTDPRGRPPREWLHRSSLEALGPGREGSQRRELEAPWKGQAIRRCRLAPSARGRQRQLPLPDCLRRVAQGLRDVLRLQIRVELQNLLFCHPVRHHIHHHRHRNSQPTDARGSAHLVRANSDAREEHRTSVARGIQIEGRTEWFAVPRWPPGRLRRWPRTYFDGAVARKRRMGDSRTEGRMD